MSIRGHAGSTIHSVSCAVPRGTTPFLMRGCSLVVMIVALYRRLALYATSSAPLINFYRTRGEQHSGFCPSIQAFKIRCPALMDGGPGADGGAKGRQLIGGAPALDLVKGQQDKCALRVILPTRVSMLVSCRSYSVVLIPSTIPGLIRLVLFVSVFSAALSRTCFCVLISSVQPTLCLFTQGVRAHGTCPVLHARGLGVSLRVCPPRQPFKTISPARAESCQDWDFQGSQRETLVSSRVDFGEIWIRQMARSGAGFRFCL